MSAQSGPAHPGARTPMRCRGRVRPARGGSAARRRAGSRRRPGAARRATTAQRAKRWAGPRRRRRTAAPPARARRAWPARSGAPGSACAGRAARARSRASRRDLTLAAPEVVAQGAAYPSTARSTRVRSAGAKRGEDGGADPRGCEVRHARRPLCGERAGGVPPTHLVGDGGRAAVRAAGEALHVDRGRVEPVARRDSRPEQSDGAGADRGGQPDGARVRPDDEPPRCPTAAKNAANPRRSTGGTSWPSTSTGTPRPVRSATNSPRWGQRLTAMPASGTTTTGAAPAVPAPPGTAGRLPVPRRSGGSAAARSRRPPGLRPRGSAGSGGSRARRAAVGATGR